MRKPLRLAPERSGSAQWGSAQAGRWRTQHITNFRRGVRAGKKSMAKPPFSSYRYVATKVQRSLECSNCRAASLLCNACLLQPHIPVCCAPAESHALPQTWLAFAAEARPAAQCGRTNVHGHKRPWTQSQTSMVGHKRSIWRRFQIRKFRSLRRIETVMAIEHAWKEFCRLLVAKKRAGICVTAVTAGVTVASPTLLVNVRAKSLTLTYCC